MKITDRIAARLGYVPQDRLARELDRLGNLTATTKRLRASRDRAWDFIHAAQDEGMIPRDVFGPKGAWASTANCMTESESDGDLERDEIRHADLRNRLNRESDGYARLRARLAAKETP